MFLGANFHTVFRNNDVCPLGIAFAGHVTVLSKNKKEMNLVNGGSDLPDFLKVNEKINKV